jgi:UDP-hydrolysing UDP-N-acetyl-D-glucosamine 2-epimerase
MDGIRGHPDLELQVVVGCSAYKDYNVKMNQEPDFRLQTLLYDDNVDAMATTTGLLLTKVVDVIRKLEPDIALIHADRYELLACAIACAYMNIPIAHTEGGEDTGTIDNKVRYAISSLADIHFPVTHKAYVRLMGVLRSGKNVHTVGSPALDNIATMDLRLDQARDEPYVVILHHPNTTDPEEITPLLEALGQLSIKKVWVNPNVDAGNKKIAKAFYDLGVETTKNLSPKEYIRLIYNSKCLIGNTSSGIKEGAFLGIPYVCIGKRQGTREHGDNVIFVSYDTESILGAIKRQIKHGKYKRDYRFGDGHSAEKIVKILAEWRAR